MQSNRVFVFNLRALIIWKAIVLFAVGLALGLGLLFAAAEADLIPDFLLNGIGHALAVLMIVLVGLSAKNWASVAARFEIEPEGLRITFRKPRQIFEPVDRMIFWRELAEWRTEIGHVSAHSVALPEFSVRLADGQKIWFYLIAGEDSVELFWQYFQAKLLEINAEDRSLGRVRRSVGFMKSSGGFRLMAVFSSVYFLIGLQSFLSGDAHDRLGMLVFFSFLSLGFLAAGFFLRRAGRKEEAAEALED